MTPSDAASCTRDLTYLQALEYRAPFLIDKLLNEQIVQNRGDGEALFAEVVKYLIINQAYPGRHWVMFSRLVDEVWHQFVLFTGEYTEFCNRYFGSYLHHAPDNAPGLPARAPGSIASEMAEFHRCYEDLFGMAVPDLWRDTAVVTLNQRLLLNEVGGALRIVREPDADMIAILAKDRPMISVGGGAQDALEFMMRTKTFFVRELPGDLTEDEKLGLVDMLVTHRVLVLAV
jgi:hypothetical protein